MAPNFQSSFIPKEPVATKEVFKKKKTGIVGVLAFSLFAASVVISIGLYFYKGMIKSDTQSLRTELAESEKALDKKTITELSDFNKKLGIAKSLILKHKVMSGFLDMLASSTVSSVRFTGLNYDYGDDGVLSVKMAGESIGYAAISQQESVFSQNKYFKSVTFSDLTLGLNGRVSFELAVSLDPAIASYAP